MTAVILETPLNLSQPLRGRTALVTGAATGIGAAIADALATAGASVVISHLAQHDQAAKLIGRLCVAAIAVSADLTNPSEVPPSPGRSMVPPRQSTSWSITRGLTPECPGTK